MRTLTVGLVALAAFMTAGCGQEVTVTGSGGKEMTTHAPETVVLHRGRSEFVKIAVEREGFRGPVTVMLSQLPEGVSVDGSSRTIETDMATFKLTAGQDAELIGGHQVRVTATAEDMRSDMHFSLDIEE